MEPASEPQRKRQDILLENAQEFGHITQEYNIELLLNNRKEHYFNPTTKRRKTLLKFS